MKTLLQLVIILFITLFITIGCGGGMGINFQDGSWSACYYEKDGKKKGPFPVQVLPGLPLVWEEDGWGVRCEPIPSAQAPV